MTKKVISERKANRTKLDCTSSQAETPDYTSHKDQVKQALPPKERIASLEHELFAAFNEHIVRQEVAIIRFGELNAEELAVAFLNHPIIVKPILTCVNVASRAIKRDLGFDIDTYAKSISTEHANLLAGYIKPFLPETIALPALMELDRYFWTDKEMRANKGNWEKTVTDSVVEITDLPFKKRRFIASDNSYELDAAYPPIGSQIQIGIDIKRIESTRDIHKRGDEIVNKSIKFKAAYPNGKFIAVVYFPFPTQHINLQSRLQNSKIDHLFFAGESRSSIYSCAEMIKSSIGKLNEQTPDDDQ